MINPNKTLEQIIETFVKSGNHEEFLHYCNEIIYSYNLGETEFERGISEGERRVLIAIVEACNAQVKPLVKQTKEVN